MPGFSKYASFHSSIDFCANTPFGTGPGYYCRSSASYLDPNDDAGSHCGHRSMVGRQGCYFCIAAERRGGSGRAESSAEAAYMGGQERRGRRAGLVTTARHSASGVQQRLGAGAGAGGGGVHRLRVLGDGRDAGRGRGRRGRGAGVDGPGASAGPGWRR